MQIKTIDYTGSVSVRGDLTGDERTVRVSLPMIEIRIDPGECEGDPIMWTDPLQSEMLVEIILEHAREWLIAQR